MAHIRDVVFDCRHPASIARFWAATLDGYEVAPYDEAELARLVELSARVQAEYPTLVRLADPDGNEFCLSRSR